MDCKKLGRIKEGIVSKAFIQVMAMPDMVFLSVDSYLTEGAGSLSQDQFFNIPS